MVNSLDVFFDNTIVLFCFWNMFTGTGIVGSKLVYILHFIQKWFQDCFNTEDRMFIQTNNMDQDTPVIICGLGWHLLCSAIHDVLGYGSKEG